MLTTRMLSSAMPNFGFGELYNKMKTNDGRNVWLMRIRITSNAIETMRSDFNKMSTKKADEVVYLKNRHQGSVASTVSGSTGSGGSGESPYVQDGATSCRGFESNSQRVEQLEERSRHRHHIGGGQTTRVHD